MAPASEYEIEHFQDAVHTCLMMVKSPLMLCVRDYISGRVGSENGLQESRQCSEARHADCSSHPARSLFGSIVFYSPKLLPPSVE